MNGDGQSLLFSVIQDITDQRVAELSLQAYEDDLEQLVIRRTEEAMDARALLDQALFAITLAAVLALIVISYFLWQNRHLLKKERAARSDVLMLDAQAYELTFFDSLTGLPNRQHILSKLKDALQASQSGQAWRHLSLPPDFSLSINISPIQFLQKISHVESPSCWITTTSTRPRSSSS